MTKPVLPYANNKDNDHQRNLISVFIVHSLDRFDHILFKNSNKCVMHNKCVMRERK